MAAGRGRAARLGPAGRGMERAPSCWSPLQVLGSAVAMPPGRPCHHDGSACAPVLGAHRGRAGPRCSGAPVLKALGARLWPRGTRHLRGPGALRVSLRAGRSWGGAQGAAGLLLGRLLWGSPPLNTGRVGSVCSLVSSNHFLSCVLAVFFFQRAGPLPQPTSGLPFGIGTPSCTSGACPFGDHQLGQTLIHPFHCGWQRGCADPVPQPCHPPCPTAWAPRPPLLPAGFGQGDGWVGGRPAT